MKKIKLFAYMFKQVLEVSPPRFRRRLPVLFCFMMVSSILELLSVALVVPFINAVMDADVLMENRYVIVIREVFGIQDKYTLVLFFALVLIVAFVVKNAVLLAVRQYQNAYQMDLQMELSTKLLRSYLSRPYSFFLQQNTGALAGRIGGDTSAICNVLNCYLTIAAEGLTVLAIGAYIFSTDPVLAIGVLTAAVVCVIVTVLVLKKRIAILGDASRKAGYENLMGMMQALGGIKEITVMRRREFFTDSYARTYRRMAECNKKYNFLNMLPERLIEVFFVSSVILIVTVRMRWGTDMTAYVSKLAAFAMAAFRLLPSISKFTSNANQLIFCQPALNSGYRAIKESESYTSDLESRSVENADSSPKLLQKTVAIRNLTFRYRRELEPVLQKLDLTIQKGEAVGLVGESGAGKSTLADIVLGLLDPEDGAVTMDGMDICTIPVSWSKNIGYVPQSVYLVDGSVRANVAFGMEKETVTDEAVWLALERAQLKSFVEGLEGGLDARVGERGIQLSGGQRQRIAIARALYLKPTILVLDEATSALDNETEAAIMESIENLMGTVTMLIVAHRLTTIRNCDTIYEIKDGKAFRKTKEELGIA